MHRDQEQHQYPHLPFGTSNTVCSSTPLSKPPARVDRGRFNWKRGTNMLIYPQLQLDRHTRLSPLRLIVARNGLQELWSQGKSSDDFL